jgi:hypothetical protein
MNTKLLNRKKYIALGNKEYSKTLWQFAEKFASIGASFLGDHLVSLLWSLK